MDADSTRANDLSQLPRITLTDRQLFDLEQLLVGGFAPLTGFLNEQDYKSVVKDLRLASGALWPIPIIFDQPKDHGRRVGDKVVLCDQYGNPIAFFTIESIYEPDKHLEARQVYGTLDLAHPGVKYLFEETGPVYFGGTVTLIKHALQHDFKELRLTPAELKEQFKTAAGKRSLRSRRAIQCIARMLNSSGDQPRRLVGKRLSIRSSV